MQKYYDEGHGVNECRREFGICAAVWYSAVAKGKIVKHGDHRIPLEVLLVAGRGTVRSHLKARLLGAGLLANKMCRMWYNRVEREKAVVGIAPSQWGQRRQSP